MGITYDLAEFVAATEYGDLPDTVVQRMKVYTLDALAAGFAGSRLRWATMVGDMVREQGGAQESSVFGQPGKVSASQAALLNGVMVSGFESDHSGHASHPAGTVTPAALAISERERVSGRDFLLATALGYEVACRIGEAQTRAVEQERGFHNPSANGPFSAAAAVGKLFNFNAMTQGRAFGIAGSHSCGLVEYAWDGSMTKRLHLGRASQSGLESAVLAAKGFTGPITILEGRYGYFNAFSPSPRPEMVLSGLGAEWRLKNVRVKAYPCHGTSQAIVVAIQALKRERSIDPDAVSRVHVKASRRVIQSRFLNQRPNSEMGAQYSMPFNIAVAFYRNLDDPMQYDESVLEDEPILRLAQAVTWEATEDRHEPLSAEIEVTEGGEVYTLQAGMFRGSLQNPATLEDVEDKFSRFSKHIVDEDRQRQIVEMVHRLDDLGDVSELAGAVRG